MATIHLENGIISSSADYSLYRGLSKIATVQDGEFRVLGDLIAENYIVSSSVTNIEYQSLSGSTIFGDSADDTHTFLGNTISGSSTSTGSFGAGYIDGHLGINTASPSAKLEIVNGVGNGTAYNVIKIDADTGNYGGQWITNTWGNGQQGRIGFYGTGTTSATRGAALIGGTGTVPQLFVNGSGNVGIGTVVPTGLLSFPAADSATPKIRFLTTAATNLADAALSTTDDSGGTELLIGSNISLNASGAITRFTTGRSGTGIQFGYTGRIKFFTETGTTVPSEKMRLDENGRLGIGTSSPAAQLHISSSATTTNVVEITGPNQTTGNLLDIENTSAATNARDMVFIHNASSTATGTTPLVIENDSLTFGMKILKPTNFSGWGDGLQIMSVDENTGSDLLWIETNSTTKGSGNIRFLVRGDGKVGIGTATPTYELDVAGDIGIDEYIYHNGDTDTKIAFGTDSITFTAGNVEMMKFSEGSTDEVVINEGSADVNFRVESNGEANMLFVNGGTNQVSVGSYSITSPFEGDADRDFKHDSPFTVFSTGELGNSDGDTVGMATFGYEGATSNGHYLEFFGVRDTAGTTWESAGTRIQKVIDTTGMGYIEFNGAAGNAGIGFGTGTTSSGYGDTIAMTIDASSNVAINGYSTVLGGVHVGGTSDPGDDNLLVDGVITALAQPAFFAYNSAADDNKSINTQHTVDFNTEVYDVGNDFTSDVFTAPVDGIYLLTYTLRLAYLDTLANYYAARINTTDYNYTTFLDPNFSADTHVSGYMHIADSVHAHMSAGDTAKVEFYQSGGTAQADIEGSSSQPHTRFFGYLLPS